MFGWCVWRPYVKGKDYSICDGRYTIGWLEENAGGGVEKKLSEKWRTWKAKHGSGWRGVAGLHLCSTGVWFDSIPLRSDPTLTCMTSGHSWPWPLLQMSCNTATQAITQGLSAAVKEELNVYGLSLTLTFSGRWTVPNPTFDVTSQCVRKHWKLIAEGR